MPKRQHRRFTQEFKDEAVRMVLEGDRTVVDVAREFGIHDTTLGNWVRLYKNQHEGEEMQSLSGAGTGAAARVGAGEQGTA